MVHEMSRRRSIFRDGIVIHLSNGEPWTFPQSPFGTDRTVRNGAMDRSPRQDSEYHDLIHGCLEAEDPADRRRSELALAIYLLQRNYDLLPDELRGLLTITNRNSSEADELREGIAALARGHLWSFRRTAQFKADIEHGPRGPRYILQGWWDRLRNFRYAEPTA